MIPLFSVDQIEQAFLLWGQRIADDPIKFADQEYLDTLTPEERAELDSDYFISLLMENVS